MAVLLHFNSVDRLLCYMLHELTIFRHPHIKWLYCCSLTVSTYCYFICYMSWFFFRHKHIKCLYCCSLTVSTDWPFNRWKTVCSSSLNVLTSLYVLYQYQNKRKLSVSHLQNCQFCLNINAIRTIISNKAKYKTLTL